MRGHSAFLPVMLMPGSSTMLYSLWDLLPSSVSSLRSSMLENEMLFDHVKVRHLNTHRGSLAPWFNEASTPSDRHN